MEIIHVREYHKRMEKKGSNMQAMAFKNGGEYVKRGYVLCRDNSYSLFSKKKEAEKALQFSASL